MKKAQMFLSMLLVSGVMLTGCLNNTPKDETKPEVNPTAEATKPADSISEKVTGTMKDLLGSKKSQVCTAKSADGESTVYISGEKMRAESKTTVEGEVVDMVVISDGSWQYIWDQNSKEGMKLQAEEVDTKDLPDVGQGQDTTSEVAGTGAENLTDESFDFDCKGWNVDEKKFVPPIDIVFQDLNAMMEGLDFGTDSLPSESE